MNYNTPTVPPMPSGFAQPASTPAPAMQQQQYPGFVAPPQLQQEQQQEPQRQPTGMLAQPQPMPPVQNFKQGGLVTKYAEGGVAEAPVPEDEQIFNSYVQTRMKDTWGGPQEDRKEVMGEIKEEYPERFAGMQEENTDQKLADLERIQMDPEKILNKSPEALRKFDTWLLKQAPYVYDVAYGSEKTETIPTSDTEAFGVTNALDRNAVVAGAMGENLHDNTVLHETAHATLPYEHDALSYLMRNVGLKSDPAEEEAAATTLDLYRGLARNDKETVNNAVAYLIKQRNVDSSLPYVGDPEGVQMLKENALRYVFDIADKNPDVEMSDEDRRNLAMDVEMAFDKNFNTIRASVRETFDEWDRIQAERQNQR